MSTTPFYCHIDKKEYTLPMYLYPHARYKKDPEKFAGKWRFRPVKGETPLDINNYVTGAPKLIGAGVAIEMIKELYKKYHPELAGIKPAVIDKGSLLYQFNKFKKGYAGNTKGNWKDIDSACTRFCIAVGDIKLTDIDKGDLQDALNTLKPNPQKKIVTCMSKFFTEWLFDRDYVPQITDNPFKPMGRWTLKKEDLKTAETNRLRMLKAELRCMISEADKDGEQWLVDALKISFMLGIRCGDVTSLKWDTYRPKQQEIAIYINKSVNSLGADKAIRLHITKQTHPEVMAIIRDRYLKRGVELIPARTRYGVHIEDAVVESSNYVFYRKPERVLKAIPKGKTQHCQIDDKYYSKQFKNYRDKCPDIVARMEREDGYICLHEVRSLFSRIAGVKGYSKPEVGEAMGHQYQSSVLVKHYLEGQLVKPKVILTMADLEGGEINKVFNDFDEVVEG